MVACGGKIDIYSTLHRTTIELRNAIKNADKYIIGELNTVSVSTKLQNHGSKVHRVRRKVCPQLLLKTLFQ